MVQFDPAHTYTELLGTNEPTWASPGFNKSTWVLLVKLAWSVAVKQSIRRGDIIRTYGSASTDKKCYELVDGDTWRESNIAE